MTGINLHDLNITCRM